MKYMQLNSTDSVLEKSEAQLIQGCRKRLFSVMIILPSVFTYLKNKKILPSQFHKVKNDVFRCLILSHSTVYFGLNNMVCAIFDGL